MLKYSSIILLAILIMPSSHADSPFVDLSHMDRTSIHINSTSCLEYHDRKDWLSLNHTTTNAIAVSFGHHSIGHGSRTTSKTLPDSSQEEWVLPFFARLTKNTYTACDKEDHIYFALIPYDLGNAPYRHAILFELYNGIFTIIARLPGYHIERDQPLFEDEDAFWNWLRRRPVGDE
jgi:hypothetical protein